MKWYSNNRRSIIENPLYIDAHGLKVQGEGILMFLSESLGGWGSRLSGRIARGVHYFGFNCNFIDKGFE
jgi:hypothetical protein